MTGAEAKAFLEEVFTAVLAPDADATVTNRYFTEDFEQIVDGGRLNRAQFDAHLETLRREVASFAIDFTRVIAEGDEIAEVHYAKVRQKDGRVLTMKFIAFHSLRDGRIARVEEVSHLVQGAAQDVDLGSGIR
ncbi:MAG: hypothetical protein Kilf2KO_10460 [Rhodospirillales bacterium]